LNPKTINKPLEKPMQRTLLLTAALLVTGTAFGQTTQPAAPAKASTQPATTQPKPEKPKVSEKPNVPAPRDDKWVARHEGFVAQAAKGECDVLFLGDSITDGWRRTQAWKQNYEPLKALNFGISGDRTQQVLWRITHGELETIKPKVVVIMIGTNNLGDPVEATAGGVAAIVNTVREKQPQAKILLLAIFPRAPKASDKARIKNDQVNALLAKLDDGKNVKFLDIGSSFLDKEGNLPPEIMKDYLHPGEKGYEVWAQAMNPTLSELLGQKIGQ